MNFSIYQKEPDGNIQVIEQTTDTRGRDIYMKFIWDPHNPTEIHFDGNLLLHKPGKVFDHDEHNFESPSPTSLQLIMQIKKTR